MDDTLALLVGRVILAWGSLDQFIYSKLTSLQLRWGEEFIEPDDRFVHRMKLLRRMIVKMTNNDQTLLAEYDRWKTNLDRLEEKRGQLAHGSASPNFHGGISVSDYRKLREWREVSDRLRTERRLDIEKLRALWDQHHDIKYTLGDVDKLARDINSAREELQLFLLKIRQRFRELYGR